MQIKLNKIRGVAQLVARLLWEQDVGGSSPFTPTKITGLIYILILERCK